MSVFDSFSKLFYGIYNPSMYSVNTQSNEVIVSEQSVKSITAYSTGVNAIANSIASIPFKLRKDKEVLKNNLHFLIKEKPNKVTTSYQFFRFMMNQMLYRGTAISIIKRDVDTGEVNEIIPVDFTEISEAKFVDGELYYIINNIPYHNDDLLVFKISGDVAFGNDPITQFAETLGLSLSSLRYAKRGFDGDGSNIRGVLTTDTQLKDDQKAKFRKSIDEHYTGANSKSLLILDKGYDFKPVSLSPDQLKLIETRKIQIAEIARILNVPIFIVASEEAGSYNSIEAQQLDFYKRTLMPIIYMIESELKHKLLTRSQINDNHYFKGSIESLLRGSSAERTAYYTSMYYLSAISADEIRDLEDLPTIPQGETFVQTNLMPSKLATEFYQSKINQQNLKYDKNKQD